MKKDGAEYFDPHFIAYFDILGYESAMKNDDYALLLSLDIEKHIKLAKSIITEQMEPDRISIRHKVFSDNFFFCTYRDWDTMLELVLFLQALFVQHNIVIRGALCNGILHYSDDFISGKGLVEAYKLESNVAIFPRIIISDSFISAAAKVETENQDIEVTNEEICELLNRNGYGRRDFDNYYFADYLSFFRKLEHKGITDKKNLIGLVSVENLLIMHGDCIVSNLNLGKDIKVLQKYQWSRTYHNSFCKQHDFHGYLIEKENGIYRDKWWKRQDNDEQKSQAEHE